MKTIFDHLRWSILKKKGLSLPATHKPLAVLRKTERNLVFERLCRNRLLMGAFRYGELFAEDKELYISVDDIRLRLDLYEKTGNLECLVDAANYAMLEFTYSKHKNAHFKASDDLIHSINYNQKGE